MKGHKRVFSIANKHYYNISKSNRPLTTSLSKNYIKLNRVIKDNRHKRAAVKGALHRMHDNTIKREVFTSWLQVNQNSQNSI